MKIRDESTKKKMKKKTFKKSRLKLSSVALAKYQTRKLEKYLSLTGVIIRKYIFIYWYFIAKYKSALFIGMRIITSCFYSLIW